MKAVGNVVAKLLGFKRPKKKEKQEPWWKRRIEGQIKVLRKDISKLQCLKEEKLNNRDLIKSLGRQYRTKKKGLNLVIEELKQRVTAKAAKIKRYENRIEQFRQNRMFQKNQRRLFEQLERQERQDDVIPDAEESRQFWRGIWSEEVFHNESAEWLKGIEKKLEDTGQQEDIVITPELFLTRYANKLPNWKAPGPDGLQGFWLKNIKSIRQALTAVLNECLNKNQIPDWVTKGVTTLIIKDKTKGNVITNFRPITCLPLMWKLLTGVLADEMYAHLERNNLLPDEQRGCRKRARGSRTSY